MEKKSTVMLSFIVGAAVGAAIGYLLASGKGEQILNDIKDMANKAKDEFDKKVDEGKEFLEDIGSSASQS